MSIGALIEKFREVALDRLEAMNLTMLSLERDPSDHDALEALMREIHTLKGEAKMLGFADVNLVAHQLEEVLLSATARALLDSREVSNVTFEGFDLIRALLTKRIGSNDEPIDLSRFVAHVHHAQEALEARPEGASEASADATSETTSEDSGAQTALLTPVSPQLATYVPPPVTVNAEHSLEVAHADEAATQDQGLVAPPRGLAPRVMMSGEVALTRELTGQDDQEGMTYSTSMRAVARPGREGAAGALRLQAESTLRVSFEKLERLGDTTSEVLLMGRRVDFQLGQLETLRQELRDWMELVARNLPKSQLATLRELGHRLDAVSTAARDDSHLVSLRAVQLDEEVRRLRHVPLAQVTAHYPRAVRDLAQAQGKQVRFLQEVGALEVDRGILTALSDPLLHLIRNAVDHGLEPAHERIAANKPPEGTLTLSAEHIGDSLRVVLRDDGRGIDPHHIRDRAVARGLREPHEADLMSDQDALALIFEPGFSTREAVSDVSGRGIGMDIVLRQITHLGGVVDVESAVGAGTTFSLFLPLSSAVTSVLLVSLGGRVFGLPAKDLERVDRRTPRQLIHVHGTPCVREGQEFLPLLDWRPALGLEPAPRDPTALHVLILRKGMRKVAVWVDDVLGEREALNRPLGAFLQGVRLCRGVALTDADEVVPLLNTVELLTRAQAEGAPSGPLPTLDRPSWSTLERREVDVTRTILLAEDSEITRQLVSNTLRNLGYRVLEAFDGQRAVEMLADHRVDLLISDIQMPRLDGLGLLERVRANPSTRDMPVIMLSTLGSPEDKERAMQRGADAYLVKLDFREKELIDTVRRYLRDTSR